MGWKDRLGKLVHGSGLGDQDVPMLTPAEADEVRGQVCEILREWGYEAEPGADSVRVLDPPVTVTLWQIGAAIRQDWQNERGLSEHIIEHFTSLGLSPSDQGLTGQGATSAPDPDEVSWRDVMLSEDEDEDDPAGQPHSGPAQDPQSGRGEGSWQQEESGRGEGSWQQEQSDQQAESTGTAEPRRSVVPIVPLRAAPTVLATRSQSQKSHTNTPGKITPLATPVTPKRSRPPLGPLVQYLRASRPEDAHNPGREEFMPGVSIVIAEIKAGELRDRDPREILSAGGMDLCRTKGLASLSAQFEGNRFDVEVCPSVREPYFQEVRSAWQLTASIPLIMEEAMDRLAPEESTQHGVLFSIAEANCFAFHVLSEPLAAAWALLYLPSQAAARHDRGVEPISPHTYLWRDGLVEPVTYEHDGAIGVRLDGYLNSFLDAAERQMPRAAGDGGR